MDVKGYHRKNRWHRIANRLKHPWPFYKKVGGISAVVIHADGSRDDLGDISDTYAKRWGVGSGQR